MATVAVVMGIEYVAYAATGRMPRLDGCHEDAARFHAWLSAGDLRADARDVVYLSDAPGSAHAPSTRNVCAALRWLASRAREPGVARCVVYYSGHGTRQPDAREAGAQAPAPRPCLVPCDYEEAGVLDERALRTYICALPRACTLVFVADACHAGTLFGMPPAKIYRSAPPARPPRRAKRTRKKALKRKRPAVQRDDETGEEAPADAAPADAPGRPACAFYGVAACTDAEVSYLFAHLPDAARDMSLFTWAFLACAAEPGLRDARLPLDALLQAAQDRIAALIGEQHITLTAPAAAARLRAFCLVAEQ